MNNISNNQCETTKNEQIEAEEGLPEEQSLKVDNKDSYGKFNSADALLSAYNNLEAQFTKRSQELKKLQKEYDQLKSEQAQPTEKKEVLIWESASKPVQDETGSAVVEQPCDSASDLAESSEENIAKEVALFLSRNPEASNFAEEIAQKTSLRGEVEEGFLERAYIAVLQDQIKAEQNKINDEFIYSRASETPAVKEKIIRDYLGGLTSSKGVTLLSQGGQTVIMPPKKPTSIYEAGEMATEIIRKK